MAEKELKSTSLSHYYDAVPMRALALAQADAAQGKLSPEKQLRVRDTMEEVLEELSDYADEPPAGDNRSGSHAPALVAEHLSGPWRVEHPVLCAASRSPLDEAASLMLAQLLGKHGLAAGVQPFGDVVSARTLKIDAVDAPLVCLSYFGRASNPAHVRYLIRRLRRVMPKARFLAGFWMLAGQPDKAEEWRAAVGAHLVATSLSQALSHCVAEAQQHRESARVAAVGLASTDVERTASG
jgi:hypothetical protein